MRLTLVAPLVALALSLSAPAVADEPGAPSAEAGSANAPLAAARASAAPSGAVHAKSSVLPWVVGGLGAAQVITGWVLLAAAPEMPANCAESTRTCERRPGQSTESLADEQQAAADSVRMDTLGAISIASGAVFLITAVVMYLWDRRDVSASASTKPLFVPYASARAGGLAAIATF